MRERDGDTSEKWKENVKDEDITRSRGRRTEDKIEAPCKSSYERTREDAQVDEDGRSAEE